MAIKITLALVLVILLALPAQAQTMEDMIRRSKGVEETGKNVQDLGKAYEAVKFFIDKDKQKATTGDMQRSCRQALGLLLTAAGENENHTEKTRPANTKEGNLDSKVGFLQKMMTAFDNGVKTHNPQSASADTPAGQGQTIMGIFGGLMNVFDALKNVGQSTAASVQVASLRVDAGLKPDEPNRFICGQTLQDQVRKLLPF